MNDMGGFRIQAMRNVSLTATGRRTGSRRSKWAGEQGAARGARGRGARGGHVTWDTRAAWSRAVCGVPARAYTLNVKLLALNVGLMLFP